MSKASAFKALAFFKYEKYQNKTPNFNNVDTCSMFN